MAHPSPLNQTHQLGQAVFGEYGPAETSIKLVEAFDPIEIEYAAIRRHAAVIDLPQRATLTITGDDRVSFLNRMITQDLKPLSTHRACSSFWLNRKGRIDADIRVIVGTTSVLIDLDVFAAQRTIEGLGAYIITEDCQITDSTAHLHRLALHGPAAAAILAKISVHVAGVSVDAILPGEVAVVMIAGAEVTVDRRDSAGEIGLELLLEASAAERVYNAISTPWPDKAGAVTPTTELARRIGWHAYNIARIEAGSALYLLDFGPDSLPHETGDATLNDRVSFKKGCYLGQEIVARIQSLGHPKQKLVGLRVAATEPNAHGDVPQAVTGTPIVELDAPGAPVVGAVTSSAFSPMNGGGSVCLGMVKHSHAAAERHLFLQTDGARLGAVVQPGLSFLKRVL